ncbi:MAG: hypothetical protein AAGE52_31035 [Myxococcota bacterium]
MDDLHRMLALTAREFGADDARLELGGRDPGDDVVWCSLPDGVHRLVVIYDGPMPEPVSQLRERLRMFAETFTGTLGSLKAPRAAPDPRRSLDDALEVLAHQAEANDAFVVDETSPMIWGSSDGDRGPERLRDADRCAEAWALAQAAGVDLPAVLAGGDAGRLPDELGRLVPEILASAGASRTPEGWRRRLRSFAAASALRSMTAQQSGTSRWSVHDPDLAFLARGFGGIYWLVLVFESADFSELHAEAAMIHAAPWIERLVTSLPPVDPDDSPGGRVVKLRRLRPV